MDVFFSTGERSGDQIAAAVAAHLRRRMGPALEMGGLVGPLSEAAGVRNLMESAGRASAGGEMRGFAAWSRKLREAAGALQQRPPRLLVAVAHPTFNLPLAACAPAGVRRVIIAPPEIWAWEVNAVGRLIAKVIQAVTSVAAARFSPIHAGYVAAFRGPLALRSFDDLLCLTPMNAAAYGRLKTRLGAAASVVQVRHSAAAIRRDADHVRRADDLRRRLGVGDREHMLGIFPGSRRGEIDLVLPTMLQAAGTVATSGRPVRIVVSVADGSLEDAVARHVRRHNRLAAGPAVTWTDAPSNDLLCASCHSILASGTLTLEAAALGATATVAYTLPLATRSLLRPLFHHHRIAGRQSPFALPNAILAWRGTPWEKLPYREFTLRHFRARSIARAVLEALPAGPHDSACPPLLNAASVESLWQALCPSPQAVSAEQYVADALEQRMKG